jgi:hypothetical protein
MEQLGVMNHLHASSLSQVAEAVQSRDFPSLKMTKDVNPAVCYRIAAAITLQYLERFRLVSTLSCVRTETEVEAAPGMIPAVAKRELGIQNETDLLHELVAEWATTGEDVVRGNLETLRGRVSERIERLSGEKPRKRRKSRRGKPGP